MQTSDNLEARAEVGLISSLFFSDHAQSEPYLQAITEDHFLYFGDFYIAVRNWIEERQPAKDFIMFHAKHKNKDWYSVLSDETLHVNISGYLKTVKEASIKRRLVAALDTDDMAAIRRIALDVRNTESVVNINNMQNIILRWWDQLNDKINGKKDWLFTGNYELDGMLWLTERRTLVVGARTSRGKTSFGVYAASNMFRKNVPWVYITNEMEDVELMDKIVANALGIDSIGLFTGKLTEEQKNSIYSYMTEQKDKMLNYYIAEIPKFSMSDIVNIIDLYHPRVVFVDYVQRFDIPAADNKARALDEICNELKALSREKNVLVVMMSQFNRKIDYDKDRRPELADLSDSGGIEKAADKVILLHHIDKEPDIDIAKVELIVAKNRGGKTGSVTVDYDKRVNTFKTNYIENQDPVNGGK